MINNKNIKTQELLLLTWASALGLNEFVWSQLKEMQQNKSDGGMQQNWAKVVENWAYTENYCASHTYSSFRSMDVRETQPRPTSLHRPCTSPSFSRDKTDIQLLSISTQM